MKEFAPALALLLAGLLLFTAHPPAPAVVGMGRTPTKTRHQTCRSCQRPLDDPAAMAVTAPTLISRWREHLRDHCSEVTVKSSLWAAEEWISWLRRVRRKAWERATNTDLDRWLSRNNRVQAPGGQWVTLDEPIEAGTRRNNEDVVCRLYAWATAEGLLPRNPFAKRRRTAAPEGPERYVPRTDVRRLLEAAETGGDGGRMLVMLRLTFDAGFRAGGVAAARIEDIRWSEGVIGVRGKGGHQVSDWIPMSAELRRALAVWTADRPKSGVLLPSRGPRNRGGHMTANYVTRLISEFMHANGVDETAHGLRHTAGKEIAEVENNVRAAQLFLGHKSLTTTERVYLKGAKAPVWRAVEGRPPLEDDYEVMGPPQPPRRIGETGDYGGLGDRDGGDRPGVLGSGEHRASRRRHDDG